MGQSTSILPTSHPVTVLECPTKYTNNVYRSQID